MNDVLYKNGQIYTVDDSRSWAEAVAVKDGRITFVGSNEDAKGIEAAEVIDLDGKMLLPGFIEAHGHVIPKQGILGRLLEILRFH